MSGVIPTPSTALPCVYALPAEAQRVLDEHDKARARVSAVDRLIIAIEQFKNATGSDANTLRLHPRVRERIAPVLLRRDRDNLPPVLAAMHNRERKRLNRRRRAARIKRGHR